MALDFLTFFYITNSTLLLLHEIESAFEREWEILGLPGQITGFLLLHIPVIAILFLGLLEIRQGSGWGTILGILTGACGILPFLVHKVFVRKKERFNLPISNVIIYANIFSGIGTVILSVIRR